MVDNIERTAEFSDSGIYRYTLGRRWGLPGHGAVCWIMLNPSTADADQDDPTIRRCMNFSESWGYEAMVVVNLFALRTPHPQVLKAYAGDPVGPLNDEKIWMYAKASALVVAAWGEHGTYRNRSGEVRQLLMDHDVDLYALRRSKSGQPSHPLYLPGDLTPSPL